MGPAALLEPIYLQYDIDKEGQGQLSVTFDSPVFLQGFLSLYQANDPRLKLEGLTIGSTTVATVSDAGLLVSPPVSY